MGYVQLYVDVDLSDIDDGELVDELTDRKLSDKYVKEILDTFGVQLKSKVIEDPRISTLADKMKYEYLMKIFDKYSLTEIEDRFPNE